jgi:hypothetical protein
MQTILSAIANLPDEPAAIVTPDRRGRKRDVADVRPSTRISRIDCTSTFADRCRPRPFG